MSSLWTTAHDFGQKIDLCVRLREILRNYPEGLSIFKELIQNADDAGADMIRFCIHEPRRQDEHAAATTTTDPLYPIFQGPSLLVYNSGIFTKDDFASIQNIGDSIKKGTDKTGRFGLGFNSTYHLTDIPMFVSGSKIVLLDPHATYIPGINPINPGKLIDFSTLEGQTLIQSFPYIFKPMEIFGCSFQTKSIHEFHGTLFQFPLRSPHQATISRLSNRSYTLESIRLLLEDLSDQAADMLLFLRNIQRIEVYDWKKELDQPTLLSYTEISNGKDIHTQRSKIPTPLTSGNSHVVDYTLHIECFGLNYNNNMTKKKSEVWIVCYQLGGGNASKMAYDPTHSHMKLIPLASVATRVKPSLMENDSGTAYCFLPLPLKTSLNIHVNGYFELSSNRRDLWWGSDMMGDGQVRADWNKALLQDIAAPCYGRLIEQCIRSGYVTPETYEFLLPRTHDIAEPWKWLARCFFQYMNDRPILYSHCSNIWIAPREAYALENLDDMSIVKTLPIFNIALVISRKDNSHSLLDEWPGMNHVSLPTLIIKHIIPFLGSVPIDTVLVAMKEILLHTRNLLHLDSDLQAFFSTAKIIPSLATNTLKCPAELYDPRVSQFQSLIGIDSFPNETFSDETMLTVLLTLGLKHTLTWETIVACAQSIELETACPGDVDKPHDGAFERAHELLSFLQQNEQSFFPSKRKDMSFAKRIFRKLSREVFDDNPDGVPCQHDRWIEQLLKIKWIPVIKYPIHHLLPWREPSLSFAAPIETTTIDNVWFISSSKYISAVTIGSSAIKNRFGWNERPCLEYVALQLKALSMKFSQLCNEHVVSGVPQTLGDIGYRDQHYYTRLSDEIPRNDKNIDHNSLCRKISEELPRLYGILNEAKDRDVEFLKDILGLDFPWLWTGGTFASILNVAFNSPLNAEPYLFVVPSDLACFTRLLSIFNVKTSFSTADYYHALKRISDTEIVDQRSIDIAIALVQIISDDEEFVKDVTPMYAPGEDGVIKVVSEFVYDDTPWLGRQIPSKSNLNYLHPKLSAAVANRIGVHGVRAHLLKSSSDELPFKPILEHEEFRQSESITKRLQSIIEMYPEGQQPFHELIQNADDAKATTVRFVFSSKQYGCSSLLGEALKLWQGPSLYCFNDSVFSEKDFRNIARIGQTSKLNSFDMTGRFGLGFNSVFHWTDLPSFISGEHLVVFDPHSIYLPEGSGGMRIQFTKATSGSFLEHFPDQSQPFLLFGSNMRDFFKGTLFRFPFRTLVASRASEISKRTFDLESLTSMLHSAQSTLHHAILFLRHINNIELYTHDAADDNPRLVYRVSRKWFDLRNDSRFDATHIFDGLKKESVYTKLASLSMLETPITDRKLRVSRHFVESNTITTEDYLVSYMIGNGECRDMALDPEFRSMKFLPWASIATPLDQHTRQPSGRVFCVLPLPTETGLASHVNGNFELSSNRRDIWTGTDMIGIGKIRSQWNILLIRDVVAPLYCHSLEVMKTLSATRDDYYALWPVASSSDIWKTVQRTVYQYSMTQLLFQSGPSGAWVSGSQCILYAPEENENTPSYINEMIPFLLKQAAPLVSIPRALLSALRDAKVPLNELSLSTLSAVVRIPNRLGQMVCADELFDPSEAGICDIVGPFALPESSICDSYSLKSLRYLGMKTKVSLQFIIDCAKMLHKLIVLDEQRYLQASALLTYLDDTNIFIGFEDESCSENSIHELRSLRWVPVMPLGERHSKFSLTSPDHCRLMENKYLCDATYDIINQQMKSQRLIQFFGWDEPIPVSVMVTQIISISSQYRRTPENPGSMATNLLRLYSLVDSRIRDDPMSHSFEALDECPWIWVGDRFVMKNQVAINTNINMEPYLYSIPLEMRCFEHLLKETAISEQFRSDDYVNVLQQIATDLNGKCCDTKQLELALLLCRLISREDETLLTNDVFYLPTREGLIRKASDVMYDDAPWLSEIIGKKLKDRYLFVHDAVDRDTARRMGARSLRETLSGQYSQGMITIPCPKPEPLQILLSCRRNRDDYIRKFLNEIIEVAERQGAKHFRLLFDERIHENTSILHPCLGTLQGNSLMVYMDVALEVVDVVKLLSPAQCYNSSDLIGNGYPRFGAGLCGAFLLTDCVQILTKRSFLLFDPTGEYLFDDVGSKADTDIRMKRKPGARNYNLSLDIVRTFSHQFYPFFSAPFGFQESIVQSANDGLFYNGTIIRIPLRSISSSFSLCRDIFEEREINDIIDKVKQMIPESLIFLQSLQRLSIDSWKPSEICHKSILDCLISRSQVIHQSIADHSRSSDGWKSSIMKYLGERNRFSSYIVDIAHQQIVGKFLICSVSIPIQSDKEWAGMKLNPSVSVAIPVMQTESMKPFEGSVFASGLNTNIKIGIPMHLNAPLFLHEWKGEILMDVDDDMDIKLAFHSTRGYWYHKWNQECIGTVINQLIPSAFERSTEYFLLNEDPRRIYCFWPFLRRIKMPFRNLVQETLITGLCSKSIFLKLDSFEPISNGYFEYPRNRAPIFFRDHSELLFNVPKNVFSDLSQYSTNAVCFTPATARKLLKKNPIRAQLLTKRFDVISIFEYCVSDFIEEPGDVLSPKAIAICKNELIGLPLLLSSNGKVVDVGSPVIAADNEQQYLLPTVSESGGFLASVAVKKWGRLFKKGFLELCGIGRFDHKILLRHISSVLPKSFENKDVVSWDSHDSELSHEKHPTRLWIYLFWKNVPIYNNAIVQLFRRWPLIPTVHNELISCAHYQHIISIRRHSVDVDLREAILSHRSNILLKTKVVVDNTQSDVATEEAVNDEKDEYWNLGFIDSSKKIPDIDSEGTITCVQEENLPKENTLEDTHDSSNPAYFNLDVSAYDILFRLKCPIISSAYFSDNDLSRLDPSDQLSSTRMIMSTINFWMSQVDSSDGSSHLKWTALSPDDRSLLLQLLVYNNQMTRLSMSATDYSVLKRLPLFEALNGSHSDLMDKEATFVLDRMVDFDSFQHVLPRSFNLLVDNHKFRDLYEDLQVHVLTESLLVRNLLSKDFRDLSVERRDEIFQIIVNRWPRIREDVESCKEHLSRIPFIRTKQQDTVVYACPGQLYDPRNPFFQDIFKGSSAYFPTEEYDSDRSLDFLVCAGMIHNVDRESFLKAALIVEEEGSVPKAMVLWKYFSSSYNDFHDATNNFLLVLSRVKCVPAESEYAEVALHYFSDVSIPRDKNLSFTVLPTALEDILPPQFMFSRLHISSPPPLAVVLKHLRVLTDDNIISEKWLKKYSTIEKVFVDIFSFLQDNLPKLSAKVIEGLKCRSFIPLIDGLLVKPEKVFFRLPKDLSPFIWELPRCFNSFETLLRVLGVRESPTIDDCIFLLKELYESKTYLNVNELNAIIDVFNLICRSGSSNSLSYLPDQDGFIMRIDEILIDDDSGLINSDRIDNDRVKLLHPALIDIAQELGVGLVSERIVEKLAETPVALSPQPYDLRRMQRILQSNDCRNILRTLADAESIESITAQLSITGVISIHTKFFLISRNSEDAAVDITNYSSKNFSKVFLDGSTLFVSTSSALTPYFVATKLCNLFKVNHKYSAGIAALLASGESDIFSTTGTLLFQNMSNEKMNRGAPGVRLTPSDYSLIEMLPSKTYRKGETVAIKGEGEEFIYGVVDSFFQGEMSVISRIRVQVSKTRIEDLLSSNVWSFKSGRKRDHIDVSRQVELSPTITESRKTSGISPVKTKILTSIRRDEIIDAVDGLLSLANLSLTHDAQTVMRSNLALVEKYERISRYSNNLSDSVTKLADAYLCPITREVMKDPVMCSDGHSYERYAIERWLQSSRKSPKTNEVLSSTILIPNIAVRAALESIQEVEYARKDLNDSERSR